LGFRSTLGLPLGGYVVLYLVRPLVASSAQQGCRVWRLSTLLVVLLDAGSS
jgi:hypothetical protein